MPGQPLIVSMEIVCASPWKHALITATVTTIKRLTARRKYCQLVSLVTKYPRDNCTDLDIRSWLIAAPKKILSKKDLRVLFVLCKKNTETAH